MRAGSLQEFLAIEQAELDRKRNAELAKQSEEFETQRLELSRNAGRLLIAERKRLTEGRDPHVFVPKELEAVSATQQSAIAFNKRAMEEFRAKTPEFRPSSHNIDLMVRYWQNNSLAIISCSMAQKLHERLQDAGLYDWQIEEVQRDAAFREQEERNRQAAQEQASEDDLENIPRLSPHAKRRPGWIRKADLPMVGMDQELGVLREFSPVEIERMSGDLYRKVFITTAPESLIDEIFET